MFWVLLLLLAWVFAGTACTGLCLAAVRAAAADTRAVAPAGEHDLTLYEAAFLSGGPARVADVTLVSMARQRRLLLAHTGWATVVDPRGRDEMERSVIGAIGPEGQSRIAPVRARAAGAEAVRRLADGLVRSGLAVPDGTGSTVGAAVRRVRAAALVVAALGTAALLLPVQTGTPRLLVGLWFALPLTLSLFQRAEGVVRDNMAAIPLWYQNGSAGYSERLS
ncbi:TIGR04222 domain-containing membrane protein, partial [Streptomyces sp. NPDC004561]